eukprot:8453-Heterococcus_DN1.PRE.5
MHRLLAYLFVCKPLSWSQDATNPGVGCGAAAVAAFLDGTAATASGSSTLFFFAEEEEVEVSREVEEQYEEQIPIETSAELLNGAAGSEAGADGLTPDATAKAKCSRATALHARATLQTASAPPSTNGDAAHLDAAAAGSNSINSNRSNSNGDAGASLNGDSPPLNGSASDSASVNGDAAAAATAAAVAMQTVTRTRLITVTSTELQQRCRCVPGVVPDSAARVVYLVREGELPAASSRSLDEDMCKVVEFGFLTGDFLNNLSTILKEVYAPLLDQQMGGSSSVAAMASHDASSNSTSNGAATTTREVVKSGDSSRNEFRSNLQKFESQVSHAMQQVKGDVHLSVPSNINIDDPERTYVAQQRDGVTVVQ